MLVGTPIRDCEVRVVDDDDQPLARGTVGHLQIRGGNVTSGYAGLPPEQQPFTADGWLRTGDLGFLTVADGELVITGRQKEIIFVNGQNYYPHDLEAIAEQHAGCRTGQDCRGRLTQGAGRRGGAAAVPDPSRVPPRNSCRIAAPVRRQITEQTGLNVAHVIPVRNLPKTTSGKLQRGKLAQAYAAGEFDAVLAELEALAAAAAGAPAATRVTVRTSR